MTRRAFNWKIISLGIVAFISFIPFVLTLVSIVFFKDIKVSDPIKNLSSKQCNELLTTPCSKGYLFKKPNLAFGDSLLPGLATVPPRIRCENSSVKTDIDASQIGDCVDNFIVYFNSEMDSASASWMFPFLIYGNASKIDSLQKAVTFFRSDVRTIIAGVVPLQALLLYFLLGLLGRTKNYPYLYSFITVSVMAVLNGGIFEKAFLLPADLFGPELKEMLGLILLMIFSYETLGKTISPKKITLLVLICFFLEVIIVNFSVSKAALWSAIILGWGSLAVVSKFSFVTTAFFVLNVFYLVSVVTSLNLLPQYAGTLFFMIYLLGFQIEQVRLRLLNWRVNKLARSVHSSKRAHALVKVIARTHRIGRVSLSLVRNESFEHWSFQTGRQTPTRRADDGTSTVVSRVYASGKPLLHLNSSKNLGKKLSNRRKIYSSGLYTSLPIKHNREILGVLNITEYQKSALHQDAFEILGEVFLECSEIISRALSQVTTKFAIEFETVFCLRLENRGDASFNLIINNLMNDLFVKFGISCYFAEVDKSDTIRLLYVSGAHIGMMDEINALAFKVVSTNEFGPIGIAFKEMSPVVLQNWRLISDKISPAGRDIYARTSANSIMSVPLQITAGKKTLRYLFWLQTTTDLTFNDDFRRAGTLMQARLGALLSKELNSIANDTIFSLADESVLQKVVQGASTLIREKGDLLMVDLARSTYLSGCLGIGKFQNLIDSYNKLVTRELEAIGYTLQMVLGDALLFTRSEGSLPLLENKIIDSIYICEAKVRAVVEKYIPEYLSAREPAIRVCKVKGDISRDLVKGKGGGWTIVGSTIGEVHKIEALSKNYREGLYFELSTEYSSNTLLFKMTDVSAWPGSAKVRYLEYLPIARTNTTLAG